MKKISLVLALAVSLFLVQTAAASNLVVDGNFDQNSDFYPPWTLVGDSDNAMVMSVLPDPLSPRSTPNSAVFGAANPLDPSIIKQDILTTPGQAYILSFYLASTENTPDPQENQIIVKWGDQTVYQDTNLGAFNWTKSLDYTVIGGSGTSTALSFSFYNNPAWFALDDVSVSAVPIPGSLVLLASALLPLGWRRLRKG